jgi:hypothetical protein
MSMMRAVVQVGTAVAAVALAAGGCAGSEPAGAGASGASGTRDQPSYVLVDWPDDSDGVGALLDRLSRDFAGYDPGYAGEPGEEGFRRYFGSSDDEVRVFADPAPQGRWADAGVLPIVYTGVPAWCVDATHSADFDALYSLGEGIPFGDLEAARSVMNQVQVEVQRLDSEQPRDGTAWVECTTTYDIWNERGLDAGERSYLAAWTDDGWTFAVEATSNAARSDAIAALVRAAKTPTGVHVTE